MTLMVVAVGHVPGSSVLCPGSGSGVPGGEERTP